MNLFGVMELSATALTAQRQRAEVATANLANAETTRTEDGGPYKRKLVVFAQRRSQFQLALANAATRSIRGVEVREVVDDPAPPVMRYEPGHPDADAEGYVAYPNLNPVNEMVDLMSATRSYEANAAAVNASKQMIQSSMDLLR
jgi:flagellar basal-body rod protein FlgC